MHIVKREEDSRYMNRKRVALGLMSVFLAGYMAVGCGKKSETEEKNSTASGESQSSSEQGVDTESTTTEEITTTTESTTTMTIIDGHEYRDPQVVSKNVINPIDRWEIIRDCLLKNKDYYMSLDNNAEDTWCYKLMDDHKQSGSYEYFPIADYNGVYVDKNVTDDDKVVYLTFDCGYPSSRTPHILDILKEHNVKANFFVTKMYLEECSDYAVRMKQEGHMVCNHTVHHKDLTSLSVEEIASEIVDVAEFFYEKTGYELDPYFRTPTGSYTKRLMKIIEDCGYMTVFWSFALYDYDQNNQPAPSEVYDQFVRRHHNGAIILMHNDSSANEAALDDVLTYMQSQGYRFALLDELEK